MISGKLKQLANRHGMKIASGVAYGNMLGYAVTLNEGSGYKCMVVSTTFPDPVQKSQLESHLNQQNLVKEYRVQSLSFGEKFIRIVFTDTVGTMKKVDAFIDFFFPLLGQYGATGAEICTFCGKPLAGDGTWKLIEGTAQCLHGSCGEQLRQSISAADDQRKAEDDGSYLWGALGAFLGAAVGAILWALVLMAGYMVSLVGFVIGWLANFGYDLLHGKKNKVKVAILILAVIFGVIVGYFGGVALSFAKEISGNPYYSYSDIPDLMVYSLLEDSEFLNGAILDVLMGLAFAGIGVFALLRNVNKEVSKTKMIDLP